MVAQFNIFGRQVGSHILSMATLGATGFIAFLGTRGGKKDSKSPPIQASSSDEEKFIQEFLANAEKEGAKH